MPCGCSGAGATDAAAFPAIASGARASKLRYAAIPKNNEQSKGGDSVAGDQGKRGNTRSGRAALEPELILGGSDPGEADHFAVQSLVSFNRIKTTGRMK